MFAEALSGDVGFFIGKEIYITGGWGVAALCSYGL
jgi:hypothetical protein